MDKYRDLIYSILVSKASSGHLKNESDDAEFINRLLGSDESSEHPRIIQFEPFYPSADDFKINDNNMTRYAASSREEVSENLPKTGVSADKNYALIAETGKDGNTLLYFVSSENSGQNCILYCTQTLRYYPLQNSKFDLGILDDFSFDKFSFELLFPSAIIDAVIKNKECTFIDENSLIEDYSWMNGELNIKINNMNKFRTAMLVSGSSKTILSAGENIIIPSGLISSRLKLLLY